MFYGWKTCLQIGRGGSGKGHRDCGDGHARPGRPPRGTPVCWSRPRAAVLSSCCWPPLKDEGPESGIQSSSYLVQIDPRIVRTANVLQPPGRGCHREGMSVGDATLPMVTS